MDRAAVDIDDRLEIELKAVVLEGKADTILPMDLFLHAEHIDAVFEGAPGVAALVLGAVHGRVGLGQQVRGPIAMLRKQGHTDTGAKGNAPPVVDKLLAVEKFQQQLGRAGGLLLLGVEQDNAELIAPQPADDIGVPQFAGQQPGHLAQVFVAGMMAVGVVDIFELVQIDKQQSAAGAVAPGIGNLLIQPLLKPAAIDQGGQGVVVGQPADTLFAMLFLGNIQQ